MLEILLVRHGQTDWNVERRIMGAKPIGLNKVGRSQARALQKGLKDVPIDRICTSPLKRALQTSQIIDKGRDIPIVLEDNLQEIDYGDWVGKTFDEVRLDPRYKAYHTKPSEAASPGKETIPIVRDRAVKCLEGLRQENHLSRVVVVTHADVIKILLAHYMHLNLDEFHQLKIDNGSMSLMWFDGAAERVLAVNCRATLKDHFDLDGVRSPLKAGVPFPK